ncbi:hypothetical protein BaRGS_00004949 [Batillaria attramentaria]|uniref:Uncharacterized protein n=1 Tax=Batillaria attramentaria TaxID=370345 RepID=A0ABD0LXA4_9CAEN
MRESNYTKRALTDARRHTCARNRSGHCQRSLIGSARFLSGPLVSTSTLHKSPKPQEVLISLAMVKVAAILKTNIPSKSIQKEFLNKLSDSLAKQFYTEITVSILLVHMTV